MSEEFAFIEYWAAPSPEGENIEKMERAQQAAHAGLGESIQIEMGAELSADTSPSEPNDEETPNALHATVLGMLAHGVVADHARNLHSESNRISDGKKGNAEEPR